MRELTTGLRRTLLRTIMTTEGYDSLDELIGACTFDSICPAICTNASCGHIAELEPDQTEGWCEACDENSMVSALILAGFI